MRDRATSGRFLIFGEVLYDCFPNGSRVLGGAPFNVAWALAGMGECPFFMTSVGSDSEGESIIAAAREHGIAIEGIGRSIRHSTGKVEVILDGAEASYRMPENCAWDDIEHANIEDVDFVYHGLLALRHRNNQDVLRSILDDTSAQRFFDLNLRPPYTPFDAIEEWLVDADWLKLNLDELGAISGTRFKTLDTAKGQVETLRSRYGIKNILLTAGAEGAFAAGEFGASLISPAPSPVELVDTVGAGDAFSAAMLQQINKGVPLSNCMQSALQLASKVCAIRGALSESPGFYKS